jgi:VWFA-related protein
LRLTTHLVQVNVIVNDNRGNPISGLSQEDFSILDNGKPQEIRVFSAETNVPSASPQIPLPPDTYTNRPEEQTNIPASVTVILLDALNTEARDRPFARSQVIQALQNIRPQEYVALYWLGDSLQILHDFTSDSSVLKQVLAAFKSESKPGGEKTEVPDTRLNSPNPSIPGGQSYERNAFRHITEQRIANLVTRDRVLTTVSALIAIANHLGTRKGRKNLVWVSSAFPATLDYNDHDLDMTSRVGVDLTTDTKRAARALTNADIAVYPADARGLVGTTIRADGDTTRSVPETFDTMRLLAEHTGGKPFYGTNDISGAVRQAINDSRVTYKLGYYPTAVNWDGRFHELKVKVAVSGAKVRARSGYFALPDAPIVPVKNDHGLIAQLATSGLPATGIGLHVHAQTSMASGVSDLTAEVHIDLHEIQTQQNEGHRTAAFQSVFLQLDNRGRILKADDRTFYPDFDARTYERALQTGISDTRQVRVVPNAAQLCIVVRDAATANMGSIYLPLARYTSRPNADPSYH